MPFFWLVSVGFWGLDSDVEFWEYYDVLAWIWRPPNSRSYGLWVSPGPVLQPTGIWHSADVPQPKHESSSDLRDH